MIVEFTRDELEIIRHDFIGTLKSLEKVYFNPDNKVNILNVESLEDNLSTVVEYFKMRNLVNKIDVLLENDGE